MRSTSSLVALACACALAAPAVRMPTTTAWLRVVTSYDDNPFRYSPGDIDAFRRSLDPARFPVTAIDDAELALSGGVARRYRLAGHGGRFEFAGKLHGYAVNPEKSYGWLRVGVSQYLWRRGRVELDFLWLPSFLIRYYRSPVAPAGYEPCRFSEYLATAAFEQRLGVLTVRPYYRFQIDDYRRAFDPYDTRSHRPGIELGFEPATGLELRAGYEYRLATAAGTVPDISHVEHVLVAGAETRPRPLRRLSLGARYELSLRSYTTDNPGELDPGHADRRDVVESFRLDAGWAFGPARLVAGYEHEWRETDSPWSERIDDIKTYRRNRFSLGVVLGTALLTGSE